MKRYRDFNSYLKEIFGERVQKIPLDAGLGCPNRDGTISNKGCIFCDQKGSGTGALIHKGLSIEEQIARAKNFMEKRYGARKYIAYFQSFTNTYAPISRLKDLYDQALAHEGMVGLSVGTRPDCAGEGILDLLNSYKKKHLVWIEFGLQSSHDITLKRINRGHTASCFERSVLAANQYGLEICAHIILGLPGEDRDMMLQTARFLSNLPIQGVKIHLLYVVEGTELAEIYRKGGLRCLGQEEYANLVVDFLELLPPETIIQRLTGDPATTGLIAPSWAKEKAENLALIRDTLKRRDTWQGKLFQKSTAGK